MTIKIFVDSACDLPLSYLNQHDITLLPLHVHINNENYEDLKTIDPATLYKKIRAGEMPKTSQATPRLMDKEFVALAEANQPGIYIAFSSELSGTYQTAMMIRNQVKEEYPQLDLTIIDSKAASLGYGLIVMEAVKQLQAGATKNQLIDTIQFHCKHMEHIFTVEDLQFLARGGRLSRASAFLGGLLNIKPLLHVEDGKLIPIEKIRGRKKLLKRMVDLMEERGEALDQQVIGISHGGNIDKANELKNLIRSRLNVKDIYINIIGSAIGSHSGPDTLALFFLNKVK